jgi:FG-GAP-like repeat
LPAQSLPTQPRLDPDFFATAPFAPRIESSGIVTVLEADSVHERVFVGDAGTNTLHVLAHDRRLLSSLKLDSPPTDLVVDGERVLILESGILHPNDEPRGRLVRYRIGRDDVLQTSDVLIDSLFRPVFVQPFDFNRDGRDDFVIAEYGNNRGRLALYRAAQAGYERQVLDPAAGAIRAEIHDLTGDGAPDIVALFGQGDERIVLYVNDGRGNFVARGRTLARFPPVYGSMHFTMHDLDGDDRLDIVYVNGDNFDYSRVLKPYHGIRILANDGKGVFHERYFFPMYGAARAEVADFDRDGDLDILATSNFADSQKNPERGIMFLANAGRYDFRPFAFSIASRNRWNLTATTDLNRDGWLDVIIGAMDLDNIASLQQGARATPGGADRPATIFFENRMHNRPDRPAR